MTIPPITTSTSAPVAAPKNGATAQTIATATPDVASAATPAPPQPAAALDALLAVVTQNAAARQDGLAVLMANALRAAATTSLPDPVQSAVDQLLALHLPTDQAPDATAVKMALQTSGLFTEAFLASGATSMPVDVKTALLQLNQAAEAWLARVVIAADPKLEKASQSSPPARTAAPQQPAVRVPAPPAKNDSVKDVPAKASNTPAAAPTARPGLQASVRELTPPMTRAEPSVPAAAKSAPAAAAQPSQAPARPTATASATPLPETAPSNASTAQATIPAAFKPALQLLTQALAILAQEPTQPSAPTVPTTQSLPTARTPMISPASAPPSPPQIKASMALLSQAIETWPTPSAFSAAQPESLTLTVPAKIAAQTFATALQPSASDTADMAAPQAIKTVLVQLEDVIVPLVGRPPSPASAATTTPPVLQNAASTGAAPSTSSARDATPTAAKTPAPSEPQANSAISAKPHDSPQSASAFVSTTPAAPTPGLLPVPPAATVTPNDVRALLSLLNSAVENWQDSAPPPPSNAPNGRPVQPSVPPPTAGATSRAQSAAAPTLSEKADIALIAKTLAAGSDAALARQTLLQIASLPDGAVQTRHARWVFDLPVLTPQGPAVAQLAVERDGRNATAEQPKPVWRVQFAMDIAPLGPVRASMAISGGQAWVTVQAEKNEALEKLRGQMSWLAGALQDSDLEANIAVEPGRTARSGHRGRPLVDRAS